MRSLGSRSKSPHGLAVLLVPLGCLLLDGRLAIAKDGRPAVAAVRGKGVVPEAILRPQAWAKKEQKAAESKLKSALASLPSGKPPSWMAEIVDETKRAQAVHTLASALAESAAGNQDALKDLSPEAQRMLKELKAIKGKRASGARKSNVPAAAEIEESRRALVMPGPPNVSTDITPAAALDVLTPSPSPIPSPVVADTQPTQDAQSTDPLIVAKAKGLNNDPIRILGFVHDNIATEIYRGSKKGAVGTLREGRGNDMDQASLLIALLRAAGIPARYETGTVELSATAANTYAASESLSSTLSALAAVNNLVKAVSLGQGKGIGVQMTHTWVRAFVPATAYRGVPESEAENTWAYLAPAIKRMSTQAAVDLRDAVSFDFQGYLSKPTKQSPSEVFEQQLRGYIQSNAIECVTLDAATKRRTITPDRLPLLPAELPVRRVKTNGQVAELDNNSRHMVRLAGLSSQGTPFEYGASMASLWGKSVVVVYEAASAQDAAKIQSYGGLENTPAYAIRLKAVMKINGTAVASSAAESPGAGQTMRIDLLAPGGPSQSPTHVMTVGGVYAYALDPGIVPADLITEHQGRFDSLNGYDLEAERLYVAALSYHRDLGMARERIAALHWHRLLKNVEEDQAGIRPLLASYGSTPIRISRDVFMFDAPSTLFTSYSVDGDSHRRAMILKLSGFEGSFLEHRLGEEFRGERHYSAVGIVQQAGGNTVTFNQGNVDEGLSLVNVSDDVEQRLRDLAAQGYTITAPTGMVHVEGVGDLYGIVAVSDTGGVYEVNFSAQPLNGDVGDNGTPPSPSGGGAGQCATCGGGKPVESEVNLMSGNYFDQIAELSLPARGLPLSFVMTYSSLLGWHHSYDRRLERKSDNSLVFTDGQGVHWTFQPGTSPGAWDPPPFRFQPIQSAPGGGYVMVFPDGTRHAFGADGLLVSESDTNGHQVNIVRVDAQHLAVRGTGGGVITLAYNASGKLEAVSDSAGRSLSFAYDGAGRINEYTDVLGKSRSFTYDQGGRMRTKTDFRGNVTTISYDDLGRAVRIENPEGGVSQFAYDSRNRRVVFTDSLGEITLYEMGTLGLPTRVVDALGNEALTTFDDRGNRIAERDARGHWSRSIYNQDGTLKSHTDALGNTTSYTYAALARLETVTDANQKVTTRNTYDTNGNLLESKDALEQATTYTYEDGLPATITRPGSSITHMVYSPSGNVTSMTDATGGETAMVYDAAGHLVWMRDPNLKERTMVVDAKGRMSQMVDPSNGTTDFTYDEDGNRLSVEGPGQAHTSFTYDKKGRLLTTTDALGNKTRQEYDLLGRVVARTDARGFTTRFKFDAIGRLVSSTDPTGATTTQGYCANEASQPCKVFDPLGNVTTVAEDELGREVQRLDPLGNGTATSYDNLGRRRTVTDSAGKITRFDYDLTGRLTSVVDANEGTTGYGYDGRGNRTSVTDANNHSTSFEYDLSNRLAREVVPDEIMTTQYGYDFAGNRTTKVDGKNQNTEFVYDASRRLTDIRYQTGMPAHFEYDEAGNKTLERNGDSERHMTYDVLGRLGHVEDLTAGHSIDYTYDANGNRTSMTVMPENETTRYVWDSRGLLLSMTDPDGGMYRFAYDSAGRRVATLYPNGMVLTTTYDAGSRVSAMV
jgi:YD repeat-containing protein